MSTHGDEYRAFLRSAEWQEIKAEVIRRAGGRCQLCGSPHNLEAHHRTYRADLADLSELVCLCRDCHATFHRHRRLWDSQGVKAALVNAEGRA